MYEENLMDLFAAIYKLAVKDDIEAVKRIATKRLEKKLKPQGTPEYINQSPRILIGYKIKAREHIRKERKEIEKRVKQNVAEEALMWGGETRLMQINGIEDATTKVLERLHRCLDGEG